MKRQALVFICALAAAPALGNEVNNGGYPPYVEFGNVLKHAPVLRAELKAGQRVSYLLEETTTLLKEGAPGGWTISALATVSVVSVNPREIWLETSVSSDWSGRRQLLIRERLSQPGRKLVQQQYCRPDEPCEDVPAERLNADKYVKADYASQWGVNAPVFRLALQEQATLPTPLGAMAVVERHYTAQAERNGAPEYRTLKTWLSNEVPVFQAAKILVSAVANDPVNGFVYGQRQITVVGGVR